MPEREYIIFSDESDKDGKYFSNFYGGSIVGASQYERITRRLEAKKIEQNLFGEIKWAKVTLRYLDKYIEIMRCFFEEVAAGNVKVRLMFTQNAVVPTGLTKEDLELQYYKLYYQFIKHAFGLRFIVADSPTLLRIYLDELPDSGEKAERFKGFILGLANSKEFQTAGIILRKENIAEVRSHDHVLLQCLDVVLGSMAFRLNDRHKEKIFGSRVRGKRTRAKELLYKAIFREIRQLHPGFNPGITTGFGGDFSRLWTEAYRHWKFKSTDFVFDESKTKRYKKR